MQINIHLVSEIFLKKDRIIEEYSFETVSINKIAGKIEYKLYVKAGKNLLASMLIDEFKETYGLEAKQYALASQLKEDCKEFIATKLGMDVYSENTDDKKQFREFLVWYGGVMRRRTEGRYWTEKLTKIITEDKSASIVLVTDIRYDVYDRDEAFWIKNELNGQLVHLSRVDNSGNIIALPANTDEAHNDPLIQAKADFKVTWRHSSKLDSLKAYSRHLAKCLLAREHVD